MGDFRPRQLALVSCLLALKSVKRPNAFVTAIIGVGCTLADGKTIWPVSTGYEEWNAGKLRKLRVKENHHAGSTTVAKSVFFFVSLTIEQYSQDKSQRVMGDG